MAGTARRISLCRSYKGLLAGVSWGCWRQEAVGRLRLLPSSARTAHHFVLTMAAVCVVAGKNLYRTRSMIPNK